MICLIMVQRNTKNCFPMIINHSKFLSFVGNYKIIDDICGWDWCGGTHHCASFATQRCYLAAINNGLNRIYRKKLLL
jgi:hypothetical protein